jgi:hypothetical protein
MANLVTVHDKGLTVLYEAAHPDIEYVYFDLVGSAKRSPAPSSVPHLEWAATDGSKSSVRSRIYRPSQAHLDMGKY